MSSSRPSSSESNSTLPRTAGTIAARSATRATGSRLAGDGRPADRGGGDRLGGGDGEPGRDAGALVDLRRLADRPGEAGDDLEQELGHHRPPTETVARPHVCQAAPPPAG